MMSKIIIVDEDDNIIGSKERDEVKQEDIYRVAGLWITNSKGEILLAQRAFSKNHDPGKWGPAVAGTVEEGESYEENMIKEAREELGLEDIKLEKGSKRRTTGEYNYFSQLFLLKIDKAIEDFVVQREEVEQVMWFNKDKLKEAVEKHPEKFIRSMPCVMSKVGETIKIIK